VQAKTWTQWWIWGGGLVGLMGAILLWTALGTSVA